MTDPAVDLLQRTDRIQHHLVAALAQRDHRRDPPRLVFKGGTLLRACAMPDYRYSEDLDFDWVGSAGGFFKALADALPAASATSGAFLRLEDATVVEVILVGGTPSDVGGQPDHTGRFR